MKKMKDLKEEVLQRLQHLDGIRVESPNSITIEQMLGIVELDEKRDPDDIDGTILDPDHDFWDGYMRDDIDTAVQTMKEVRFAIRLLKDEGKFKLIEPEDKELPGVYVDVKPVVASDDEEEHYDIGFEERGSNLAMVVTTESGVYETVLYRK